jgi:BirA family biotin operon repressor/biotin-[acetyl-CoA-carboxylase] ligase
LPPESDPILPSAVKSGLETRSFGHRLYYLPFTGSTNDVASALAKRGEPEGTVVLTDYQTGGRGRFDRKWDSPPGKNLLFSMILRPRGARVSDFLGVTLVFSLVTAELLEDLLGMEVGVKWPNDVVSGTRKICGILAEGSSGKGGVDYVVVGMGINVNMEASDFPPELEGRAVSCAMLLGAPVRRAQLLADLLSRLEEAYDGFAEEGFAPFHERYSGKLVVMGKEVSFRRGDAVSAGRVAAVEDDGSLVVVAGGGRRIRLYDEEIVSWKEGT